MIEWPHSERLLRRMGNAADAQVVTALRLLVSLGEPAPHLTRVRLLRLDGMHGACRKGWIFINPSSALYADPELLAALISHEFFHSEHPDATEDDAREASRRFCERYGVDTNQFFNS